MSQASVERPRDHPSILVFDVNETLIDIESLRPLFERVFGRGDVLREWFAQLILYSMTATLAGHYQEFVTLGAGTLRMVGAIRGVEITPDAVEALESGMRTMPAHPDCVPGLARLKEAGFRLVTLTNSAPTTGRPTALDNAGLGSFFERQFSVTTAKAFKPHPSVYRMVTEALGVPARACCLVAAHAWDTIGGQAAGMAGALITRPGNASLAVPGLPQPDVMASDLTSLAEAMIRRWPPR